MKKDKYSVNKDDTFVYNGKKMLVVRMSGAACIMSEAEYNRIIIAERKYKQWKNRKVA